MIHNIGGESRSTLSHHRGFYRHDLSSPKAKKITGFPLEVQTILHSRSRIISKPALLSDTSSRLATKLGEVGESRSRRRDGLVCLNSCVHVARWR